MKPTLRNLLYSLSLSPSALVIYGNLHGGYWTWMNTVYILIVVGALEWVAPAITDNRHGNQKDLIPELILFMHVPAQLLCVVSFFYALNSGVIEGMSAFAACLSMAINSGSSAIVVAHEFIHHKSPFKQWLGKVLLFTSGNFYFYVEHLRVHHKWVGTSRDAATASKNQSLYAFAISSSMGQLKGAFRLEHERLKKLGQNPLSLKHYVIRQLVQHLILDSIIVYTIGWGALGWFVLHCILANFLLEYVNYIEHYGLRKSEKERVTEVHSWQSNVLFSRFLLIDLSRHADHHYHASKPYHTLNSYERSPELPSGYAGLFFIAACPPLWYKLMNPLLPEGM